MPAIPIRKTNPRRTAVWIAGLVSASITTATPAFAKDEVFSTEAGAVRVTTLATGLNAPWSVEVLPDGAAIVTERVGHLRIVRDGAVSQPVSGLPPIAVSGQGGLLDVALAPDFPTSRTLYLSMSVAGPGGYGTAIIKGVLSADERRLDDVRELFRMNRFTGKGQHFGSRIAIANDGTLFFGIGDRGDRTRAQDMRDHAASILRIKDDGSIPADNPHADGKAALPEIWSKGHRNPQGIVIDPETGKVITVEHGARGGDEVNIAEAGKNYGWPVITYGRDYSGADIGEGAVKDGYEQPAFYWDPSIAPGAIDVYRGAMFPEWNGDLLVAALKYQLLVRLDRDDTGKVIGEERMLEGAFGRIRDVKVAPDGAILMVTDDENGALLRMTRAVGE